MYNITFSGFFFFKLNLKEFLTNFPFFLFQANTAYKTTCIQGQDCLAIAYDVASAFLRNATEGKFIFNELKKLPNAIKRRLNFLSPNSESDYFKRSKGRDIHGESVLRQCVSIPLVDVPEKFLQILHTATGNNTAVYYFGIILRPYLVGVEWQCVGTDTTKCAGCIFLKSVNKIVFLETFEISYCLGDLLGHREEL